jgi:type I site-specific restriction-modification system R (restriction) subunit
VGAILHHLHRGRQRRHSRKNRPHPEDHIQVLKRDDGTTKNIYLIDKANIHNNALQVINQYDAGEAGARPPATM